MVDYVRMRERLEDLSDDARTRQKKAGREGLVFSCWLWQLLADVCDMIVDLGWC
jgi:hypothetical protein